MEKRKKQRVRGKKRRTATNPDRDEPLAFPMGAADEQTAQSLSDGLNKMKADGRFSQVFADMQPE